MTTIEHNKTAVRKLYEEALNKRNPAIFKEVVSENYIGPRGEKGPDGFAANFASLIRSFPDIHCEVTELVGEVDKVMVNWKWEGTQDEEFNHIPATHKKVTTTVQAVYDMKDGRITGSRSFPDRLRVLQQLDLLPEDVTKMLSHGKEQVRFIDKFVIPPAAKETFMKRTRINREFIKTLPGFVGDEAYESADKDGNIHFITIAVWENAEALKNAKEKVQEYYKKEGFDPAEMLKRLHITMDRAIYEKVQH